MSFGVIGYYIMRKLTISTISVLFGAWALFGRGGGFSGRKPAWMPVWLARNSKDADAWQLTKPVKTILSGLVAAILAAVVQLHWAAVLVGFAALVTFAFGHSVVPWKDTPAYVLRLMDMAPGWQRGIWEGALSGAVLVLPMAIWCAWWGFWLVAMVVLLGGALKPLCYYLGGMLTPRPEYNPDTLSSALHAVTAWGAMGIGVLLNA